jgi:tetratricopeptide (TPR) repeat protein
VTLHNEAVAAMGAFDYEAALQRFESLATSHPDWQDVQVDHAIAQLNRQAVGDDAAALARVQAVIARDASNARAHFVAGILQLHTGHIEPARSHFDAVMQLDGSDAHAAYYLGQSLMQLGEIASSVPWFERAIALDPYLRSAYYAGAQAARRSGNPEQAAAWLDAFQRLEHNPRAHLAEIKYTRMGAKAEVQAIKAAAARPSGRPEGEVFEPPPTGGSMLGSGGTLAIGWHAPARSELLATSAGDGEIRRYRLDAEGFALESNAGPIDALRGVNAACWGDVDSDGRLDVVLAGSGPNSLWQGVEGGGYQADPRFQIADAAAAVETVDAALFDADHDGDLDVFFVNRGGPNALWNNNGDGSWRSLSTASGFPGDRADRNPRGVLVADFDGDLDQDVFVVHDTPPHAMWINDRLWEWHAAGPEWRPVLECDMAAAVAADHDGDGEVEIVSLDSEWAVRVWDRGDGGWTQRLLAPPGVTPPIPGARADERPLRAAGLAVADVTGDGRLEVIADTGWVAGSTDAAVVQVLEGDGGVLQVLAMPHPWTLLQRADGRGPRLVGLTDQGPVVATPGRGRFGFVDALLRGRTDPGQSMRSNASGIGATLAARVGVRWTILAGVRPTAGPGQSLQPRSIGLGDSADVDFIAVDWTDGVFQTESHLSPGRVHEVVETQRQLSSCPLIFAWDGSEMRFLTDCLGVGGIGFLLSPETVATPRPHERVLLPEGRVVPRGGHLEIVLAEPMQETCYLDAVVLECVDLPPGWEVLPDERMGTGTPQPTSELRFARCSVAPIAARDGRSDRALDAVRQADGLAVDPGPRDLRFIGRVLEPYVLELEFASPLEALGDTPMLVLEGWVEYPYSQTMFAAWQAGRGYAPISLEAQGEDGQWKMLHRNIGYPAGMPRQSLYPLEGLPAGTRALRITTDLELYVDAARVVAIEPCPLAEVRRIAVSSAHLTAPGYPRRAASPQRYPDFRWDERTPFWDVRSQRGEYTRFGDVADLVSHHDGTVAVFGAGEAIHFEFPSPDRPKPGWRRQLVLDVHGWCKDMDLLTRGGDQVEPVPGEEAPRRTRHRSGR